jgi:hypothetical protein
MATFSFAGQVLNFPNLAERSPGSQTGLSLGQIGKIQHLTPDPKLMSPGGKHFGTALG